MALSDVKIKYTGDESDALASLAKIERQLKKLERTKIKPDVDTSKTRQLKDILNDIDSNLGKLSGKKISLNADTRQLSQAETQLLRIEATQKRLQSQVAKGASESTILGSRATLSNQMKQLERIQAIDLSRPFTNAGNALLGFSDKLDGLSSRLNRIPLAIAGIGSALAGGLAKAGIDTASSLENSAIGLETLLGSQEEALRIQDRILREAASTPFEIADLSSMAQQLTAVTKNGDKSIDTLLNLGKAVVASGKGTAELNNVLANLVQVASTGKLTELDVRQFQRAIPVFNDVLALSGLTADGLKDADNAAELLFEAFDKAGKEGFLKDAFANAGQSFDLIKSNVKDTINILASRAIKESGLFQDMKDGMSAVIDFFNKNQGKIIGTIKSIVSGIKEVNFAEIGKTMATIIGGAVKVFAALAGAIKPVITLLGAGSFERGLGLLLGSLVVGGPVLKGVSLLSKLFGNLLVTFGKFANGRGISNLLSLVGQSAGGNNFAVLTSGLSRLVPILSNPYVLGGAVVLTGIALAIRGIAKSAKDLSDTDLSTMLGAGIGDKLELSTEASRRNVQNLEAALAKLREDGINLTSDRVAELRRQMEALGKAGVTESVDEILTQIKTSIGFLGTFNEEFNAGLAKGLSTEEAFSKATEATKQNITKYNADIKAEAINAGRALNELADQEVKIDTSFLPFFGEKTTTINQLFEEARGNLRSQLENYAGKTKITQSIQADLSIAANDLEAREDLNKFIGGIQDIKLDPVTGKVDVVVDPNLDIDPNRIKEFSASASRYLEPAINQEFLSIGGDKIPLDLTLTIGGQEVQVSGKNIFELRRNVEDQLQQHDIDVELGRVKVINIAGVDLSATGETLATQLSTEISKAVAVGSTKQQGISEVINQIVNSGTAVALSPETITALQNIGFQASDLMRLGLEQGTITTVQDINSLLASMNIDVKAGVSMNEEQRLAFIAQLQGLGLQLDDATKQRIVTILADNAEATAKAGETANTLNTMRDQQEANPVNIRAEADTSSASRSLSDLISSFAGTVIDIGVDVVGSLADAIGFSDGGLIYRANGGSIPPTVYASRGKAITPFKPKGSDTVPAMLTPGEFVIKKSSVRKLGLGTMRSLNQGDVSGAIQKLLARPGSGSLSSLRPSASNVVTNNSNNSRTITAPITVNNYSQASERNSIFNLAGIIGSGIG